MGIKLTENQFNPIKYSERFKAQTDHLRKKQAAADKVFNNLKNRLKNRVDVLP